MMGKKGRRKLWILGTRTVLFFMLVNSSLVCGENFVEDSEAIESIRTESGIDPAGSSSFQKSTLSNEFHDSRPIGQAFGDISVSKQNDYGKDVVVNEDENLNVRSEPFQAEIQEIGNLEIIPESEATSFSNDIYAPSVEGWVPATATRSVAKSSTVKESPSGEWKWPSSGSVSEGDGKNQDDAQALADSPIPEKTQLYDYVEPILDASTPLGSGTSDVVNIPAITIEHSQPTADNFVAAAPVYSAPLSPSSTSISTQSVSTPSHSFHSQVSHSHNAFGNGHPVRIQMSIPPVRPVINSLGNVVSSVVRNIQGGINSFSIPQRPRIIGGSGQSPQVLFYPPTILSHMPQRPGPPPTILTSGNHGHPPSPGASVSTEGGKTTYTYSFGLDDGGYGQPGTGPSFAFQPSPGYSTGPPAFFHAGQRPKEVYGPDGHTPGTVTTEYGPPAHGSTEYGVPGHSPGTTSTEYGAPHNSETPSTNYGPPGHNSGAPSSEYGAPTTEYGAPGHTSGALSTNYGAPEQNPGAPSTEYGGPEHTHVGPPRGPPQYIFSTTYTSGGQRRPPPGSGYRTYGAPSTEYGAPGHISGALSTNYGPPEHTSGAPSTEYGAPTTEYGAPGQNPGTPSTGYGPPGHTSGAPSTEYGAPSTEYGPPGHTSGAPSTNYGAPEQNPGVPSTEYGGPGLTHVGPIRGPPQYIFSTTYTSGGQRRPPPGSGYRSYGSPLLISEYGPKVRGPSSRPQFLSRPFFTFLRQRQRPAAGYSRGRPPFAKGSLSSHYTSAPAVSVDHSSNEFDIFADDDSFNHPPPSETSEDHKSYEVTAEEYNSILNDLSSPSGPSPTPTSSSLSEAYGFIKGDDKPMAPYGSIKPSIDASSDDFLLSSSNSYGTPKDLKRPSTLGYYKTNSGSWYRIPYMKSRSMKGYNYKYTTLNQHPINEMDPLLLDLKDDDDDEGHDEYQEGSESELRVLDLLFDCENNRHCMRNKAISDMVDITKQPQKSIFKKAKKVLKAAIKKNQGKKGRRLKFKVIQGRSRRPFRRGQGKHARRCRRKACRKMVGG